MNKFFVLIVGLLLGIMGAQSAHAALPCDLKTDPWQIWRPVTSSEEEYVAPPFETTTTYHTPVITSIEVADILKGSGKTSKCMVILGGDVSLVIPKGFRTEEEHYGVAPINMSWVKAGNASYPIMSKYKPRVVPTQEETFVLMPPSPQPQFIQQPQRSLLYGVEEPQPESRCGGVCVAGLVFLGIIGGYAIYDHSHHSSPPPTQNSPAVVTNPGTAGPQVQSGIHLAF